MLVCWKNMNLGDVDRLSETFQQMVNDAHNGNAQAQHALGMWYELHGEYAEAGRWYKQSADQGHEGATEAYSNLVSSLKHTANE